MGHIPTFLPHSSSACIYVIPFFLLQDQQQICQSKAAPFHLFATPHRQILLGVIVPSLFADRSH